MKKKFLTWFGNLLWPYFVPMKDYDYVQDQRDRVEQDNMELLDHIYAKRYSFAELADDESALSVVEIRTYNIYLRRMEIAWHVEIPIRHWVTTINIVGEHKRIKDHVVKRLTEQFGERIKKELFK